MKITITVVIILAYLNSFSQSTMQIYKGGKVSKTINLNEIDSVNFTSCDNQPNCGILYDYDGNVYSTITIGTQCWMKENLRVTHYNNGESIPNITDNTDWSNQTTGAFCNYNNEVNKVSVYGRLYNWYAVFDSRKICPAGWRMPSDAEWLILINYVGGNDVAGGKLKSASDLWQSPNKGATNESGFTALPAGSRSYGGGLFDNLGKDAYFWSNSEQNSTVGLGCDLYYSTAFAVRGTYYKPAAFSVRCLKDN